MRHQGTGSDRKAVDIRDLDCFGRPAQLLRKRFLMGHRLGSGHLLTVAALVKLSALVLTFVAPFLSATLWCYEYGAGLVAAVAAP